MKSDETTRNKILFIGGILVLALNIYYHNWIVAGVLGLALLIRVAQIRDI